MKHRRLQFVDSPVDGDSLCVSVLNVVCRSSAVEHGDRRIDPAMQAFSGDAVDETGAVTACLFRRFQISEFIYEFRRYNVISIKRQHPFCGDAGIFETEPPLVAMAVERALNDAHVWKRSSDRRGVVSAEAVDDDDLAGPVKAVERARDVWRFVVREYERR